MAKVLIALLLSFVLGIVFLSQFSIADDVNVSVDVVPIVPPTPVEALMFALVPISLGLGYVLFLVATFIGSPKTPKELIDTTIAVVIIGLFVISAITIIVGLI